MTKHCSRPRASWLSNSHRRTELCCSGLEALSMQADTCARDEAAAAAHIQAAWRALRCRNAAFIQNLHPSIRACMARTGDTCAAARRLVAASARKKATAARDAKVATKAKHTSASCWRAQCAAGPSAAQLIASRRPPAPRSPASRHARRRGCRRCCVSSWHRYTPPQHASRRPPAASSPDAGWLLPSLLRSSTWLPSPFSAPRCPCLHHLPPHRGHRAAARPPRCGQLARTNRHSLTTRTASVWTHHGHRAHGQGCGRADARRQGGHKRGGRKEAA